MQNDRIKSLETAEKKLLEKTRDQQKKIREKLRLEKEKIMRDFLRKNLGKDFEKIVQKAVAEDAKIEVYIDGKSIDEYLNNSAGIPGGYQQQN